MSRSQASRDSWLGYAQANGLIETNGIIRAKAEGPKPSKYHNQKVQVDGYLFDSKKESQRYQELKYMQSAGLIADLELQPSFPLHVMELFRSGPIVIRTIGVMTLDFRYVDLKVYARGEVCIEDVKSEPSKTEAYALRKKLCEAIHGIQIREV